MNLRDFIVQSNAIEGITRPPFDSEILAHGRLLDLPHLDVGDLEAFVLAITGDARLRSGVGMDVRVGNHLPPPGGPAIPMALAALLSAINEKRWTPWQWHIAYETLHPFTDGNGRSGRAIWLWMRGGLDALDELPTLGFLHAFYYETLSGVRKRA